MVGKPAGLPYPYLLFKHTGRQTDCVFPAFTVLRSGTLQGMAPREASLIDTLYQAARAKLDSPFIVVRVRIYVPYSQRTACLYIDPPAVDTFRPHCIWKYKGTKNTGRIEHLLPLPYMIKFKIGILREEKIPFDRRVPLTPAQCVLVEKEFPGAEIIVQPSAHRCFPDSAYSEKGIRLSEDLSECGLLMGIKEVPPGLLLPGRKYLFFSHTIKKQPHNRSLLKSVLEKKVQLIDYECLTDKERNRIIGFGRYAGIIGAYNGVMGYGKKYNLFHLRPAYLCGNKKEMITELEKTHLPNIRIIVTGGGRVANGALETLGALKIRKVTPYEFLNYTFREPVYVQLHSADYHEAKDGSPWNSGHFYANPSEYRSTFRKYIPHCDLLIHCTFWDPNAPMLFTKEDMKNNMDFRISVIADVTCDMDGSIPSTIRASEIQDPFYGYNPVTGKEDEPFSKETITVMAVNNLPCELPADASEDFGKSLIERVFPSLFGKDTGGLIERATIARDGRLSPAFSYLEDYVR